jgi:hypothetical protein
MKKNNKGFRSDVYGTDFEEKDTKIRNKPDYGIKEVDDTLYRGATIRYEVEVYTGVWEVFTNRIKFNFKRNKKDSIKYLKEQHEIIVINLQKQGIILDASPLVLKDVTLAEGIIKRSTKFHKKHELVKKKIKGRDGRWRYKLIDVVKDKKKK